MDLMEYQGKELFRAHGVPTTPRGTVVGDADAAFAAAAGYGVPVMVKAQVLTGGRGKAGGVRYCADAAAARAAAEAILGLDIKGHRTRLVLVEPASDIAEEYYLSVLHDRVSNGYKVIASVAGGVDIEEVNRTDPDKVVKVDVDPTVGVDRSLATDIVARAALPEEVRAAAADLLVKLFAAFVAADALLLEINPLIKTLDGRVIALDSKVTIDGSALFRQPDLAEQAVEGAGHPLELAAARKGLQYVKLDGNVGVMGNGAGLVMSTLDVVAQAGGAAANFLDAGGGASAESMAEGIAFVLADPDVDVMLINIFGGITRCDDVARGVLGAIEMIGTLSTPLVVRLDGTNAEQGRRILAAAAIAGLTTAEKMNDAAAQAVALAGTAQGADA